MRAAARAIELDSTDALGYALRAVGVLLPVNEIVIPKRSRMRVAPTR